MNNTTTKPLTFEPYHPTIETYWSTDLVLDEFLIVPDDSGTIAVAEKDENGEWVIVGDGNPAHEFAREGCVEGYKCHFHGFEYIDDDGGCLECHYGEAGR